MLLWPINNAHSIGTTIIDLGWLLTAHTQSISEKMHLLETTTKLWMVIDLFCQRQKCRPMTLVSGNIRYMRIYSRGVHREEASNDTGVVDLVDDGKFQRFRWLYFFVNFRNTASVIMWRYAIPCRHVVECKMNDLEWPWVAISRQTLFSCEHF